MGSTGFGVGAGVGLDVILVSLEDFDTTGLGVTGFGVTGAGVGWGVLLVSLEDFEAVGKGVGSFVGFLLGESGTSD